MAKSVWESSWERQSLLGSGGQGQTFLVKSRTTDVIAVLKLLQPRRQKDAASRRRMHLEVTNLQILGSAQANVPKVLESNTIAFEDPSQELFFVMEHVDGPTLAELLKKKGRLDLQESATIVGSLCATLEAAFRENLVHRDIKPENIVVRESNPSDAVMVDFGLSFNAEVEGPTLSQEAFDNYFVSLPERRGPNENRRDPRSDLTGICAILHYCLTGCVPRDLRDSQNRPPHRRPGFEITGIVTDQRQRNLLESFFDRGFQVEMALRFQTVAELTSRLDEVVSGGAQRHTIEDLAAIARRESERLFLADRKTQLADFTAKAQVLSERFRKLAANVSTQLKSAPKFSLNHSRGTLDKDVPEGGRSIHERQDYTFSYAHSPLKIIVRYAVVAIGNEAAVFRRCYRADTTTDKRTHQRKPDAPMEEWQTVCRYPALDLTPPSMIETDFQDQAALAISRLSEDIQKSL